MNDEQVTKSSTEQPTQPVAESVPDPAPTQVHESELPQDQLAADGDKVVDGLDETKSNES